MIKMAHEHGYFHKHWLVLRFSAAIYVIALIASHSYLPPQYVWALATFFSIAMNFTYLIQAVSLKNFVSLELMIATGLILLSLAGFFISPWLVIAAIFLHGTWDLAKHRGTGIRFFSWYTIGCVVVDWIYAAALIAYLVLAI